MESVPEVLHHLGLINLENAVMERSERLVCGCCGRQTQTVLNGAAAQMENEWTGIRWKINECLQN